MVRITDFAEPVFSQGEERPRLQDPERLAEEGTSIRDIHRDVLGVAAIERVVAIGEFLSVTVPTRNHIFHSDKRAQPVGRIDERGRDVDAVDVATETLREIPGGTAKPAADVH